MVPNKPFLVYKESSWTYAQFAADVEHTAAWLIVRGLQAGDRLAVFSANHPTTVVLLFALARIGATMVPINPEFGVKEASYVLENARVSGVVCSGETYTRTQAACEVLVRKPWVVLNEPATDISVNSLEEERAGVSRNAPVSGDADSTCLFIYTSGTTGSPKGAMHKQRGYVITAEAFVVRMHLQPDDRALCVLPLFHINALFYSVGGALAAGATLLLAERFSASQFWQEVYSTGATTTNLIGAAASILTKRDRSEFRPGHKMTKAFVAPLNDYLLQAFQKEFEVADLIECYGMTEIPGVLSNPFLGERKLGSMGIVSPHLAKGLPQPELRIVDESFQDVTTGEHGMLLVRTPTIMQGYYRDPGRTQEAFHEGWFITGDIVWRDEDGFFWFVARQKDIIRCRGENISGAELERVISEHPDVLEAATIGVPSELGEEDILAVVVLRPTARVTPVDIAQWVRKHLAAIKVPRYVAFVKALPKTPTQRIEKFKLKADPDLLATATVIK